MSGTSSTSSTSSSASTVNGRYFGLASGLDVDSIVTGLMSKDQDKIDKAKQQETSLGWKQTAYQDIITALRAFQASYLDVDGDSSMTSTNAYGKFAITSSNGSIISATANADATAGAYDIKVLQSAAKASVQGSSISPLITGAEVTSDMLTKVPGTSFTVMVDGTARTISFGSSESYATADDLVSAINTKLKAAFGSEADGTTSVVASLKDGHIAIGAGSGYGSSITVIGGTGSTLTALGMQTGDSNKIDATAVSTDTLASVFGSAITADASGNFTVNINGTNITLNTSNSINTMMKTINKSDAGVTMSYDSLSSRFTITSNTDGLAGKVTLGDSNNTGFFDAVLGSASGRTTVAGRNALVSINGTKITSANNTISQDGITYTINGTVASGDTPQTASISLTRDTSSVVSSINTFIKAYNTLIKTINDEVTEKPDSNYQPLTDAQEKDMSDDEIEKWNVQAKKGILYNDTTLESMLSSMRNMLYTSVTTSSGKKLSLFDLGIETGDYTTNGQLELKKSTKLENYLSSSPQDVADLFSQKSTIAYSNTGYTSSGTQTQRMTQEGLAWRLQDIVKNATNSSNGSIIEIAGMNNESSSTKNYIYNQLKSLKETVTNLQTQFKKDQTRYYNQFSKLEVYMSQMNAQSSYISNMFSS